MQTDIVSDRSHAAGITSSIASGCPRAFHREGVVAAICDAGLTRLPMAATE